MKTSRIMLFTVIIPANTTLQGGDWILFNHIGGKKAAETRPNSF